MRKTGLRKSIAATTLIALTSLMSTQATAAFAVPHCIGDGEDLPPQCHHLPPATPPEPMRTSTFPVSSTSTNYFWPHMNVSRHVGEGHDIGDYLPEYSMRLECSNGYFHDFALRIVDPAYERGTSLGTIEHGYSAIFETAPGVATGVCSFVTWSAIPLHLDDSRTFAGYGGEAADGPIWQGRFEYDFGFGH